MKRQAYKRNLLFVLSMLLSPVFAQTDALLVDVPNLSSYADTEATTNIFCNGGDTDDRIFRLSLELNAAADNNVSILFGTDANANGVLDREEADAVVGWDSGSWFYRDRVNGVESQAARAEGLRRLNWELTMNPHKARGEGRDDLARRADHRLPMNPLPVPRRLTDFSADALALGSA